MSENENKTKKRATKSTRTRRGPTVQQRRNIRFPETITDRKTGSIRAAIEPSSDSECLLCTAGVNNVGYPMIQGEPAHRVMYREKKGAIPRGMEVHHLCGNRRCVRADYLIAVSRCDHLGLHRLMKELARLFQKR